MVATVASEELVVNPLRIDAMPSGSTNEKRPWFPFYTLDWINSSRVRCMSLAAQGIYIQALCMQWLEGRLPTEIEKWRKLFRGGSDSDLQEVMDAFPGGVNQRLERERTVADEIGLRRGEAARKANNVRWGSVSDRKRIRKNPHRQVHTQEQVQAHTQEQVHEQPTTPPARPRAPRTGAHAELIQFWESRWLETRLTPYAVEAKDGVAAAAILKLAKGDLAEAKARAESMLTNGDPWMAQNASMPLLRSKWNQLAVKVVPRPKTAVQNLIDQMAAMEANGHESLKEIGL